MGTAQSTTQGGDVQLDEKLRHSFAFHECLLSFAVVLLYRVSFEVSGVGMLLGTEATLVADAAVTSYRRRVRTLENYSNVVPMHFYVSGALGFFIFIFFVIIINCG